MNIKIAILDSDINYLERLSGVFQQYDELSVSVFTKKDTLEQAMEQNTFQIILFHPDISESQMVFGAGVMPICLCDDETKNRKLYPHAAVIQKYQRISNIYKEILKCYAEYADDNGMDFFQEGSAKAIAVYSPIGGSGKTTIALAVARKLHRMNKRVLFLSTEQFNSSSLHFPVQEEGITRLIEVLGGNSNFQLTLKGILKENESGLFYIEGFSRLVDYEDVSCEEIETVINKIRQCDVCEFMIIDAGSSLDKITKTVLETADKIVLVQRNSEHADIKMKFFDTQVWVKEQKERMYVVKNFAEQNKKGYELPQLQAVGVVHNYGNILSNDLLSYIEQENGIHIQSLL